MKHEIDTEKIRSAGRQLRKLAKAMQQPIPEEAIYDGRARLKDSYTNARRAGRTHPDKVEFILDDDPRHVKNQPRPVAARADYRNAGYHGKNGGPRLYRDTGVGPDGAPRRKMIAGLEAQIKLMKSKRRS